ncbi:MAG: GntR family transcriptional regulator [Faecalibacterium sp.]|jgi:GntR family transcriptional regulator of arabinose operon|nr:GntR family transcriptional regulator [Faecalibacterium sp.]
MAAKYLMLVSQLRSRLRDGRDVLAGHLPSENALAQEYGVSRQTVRQALCILAEEGRIEKRKGSGSRIVAPEEGGGRQIAVVASYLDDYIFPGVLADIRAVLAAHGYVPAVYATQNSVSAEREALQKLLAEGAAGAIIEGVRTALPSPNVDLYEQLAARRIPAVFLHGCSPQLKDAVCISDDNEGGAYLLTRTLASLGHRQIAGIFKSDDQQGLARYAGYTAALRDAGLALPAGQTLWYSTEDRQDFLDAGNTAALQNFIRRRLGACTAVLCYNDEIAYLLIRLLAAAGRLVPEDVSVASFDNSYYSDASPVPITSLGHAPHAMGRTTAEALMDLLAGIPHKSEQLAWTLHQKESTAPRKER